MIFLLHHLLFFMESLELHFAPCNIFVVVSHILPYTVLEKQIILMNWVHGSFFSLLIVTSCSSQEKSQFSIDIEHHKHRSYRGFICLIQIFTGACTYLVDAIALHDELHALNKVFSNPYIQKVMHGCHNDVMWLQQDFRVYLVNVFDTEKACQVP